MSTKLPILNQNNRIPAGIFTGTEIFAYKGQIYGIHQGTRMLFQDLPGMEKRNFIQMYIEDKAGQTFIQKHFGIIGFESGFKQWLFCKFGSLDGNPDYINGDITPDSFNSACKRTDCPGRGRFCGTVSGLNGAHIETIKQITAGKTIKETANALNLSIPAVKSRLEKIKLVLAASNIVTVGVKATELGIVNEIGNAL